MKATYFVRLLLVTILIFQSQIFVKAQTVKVFSKYNYYTIEDDVTIIAELSSYLDRSEYLLSVFSGGDKQIAKEGLQKNNQLSVKIPLTSFDPGKTELQYTVSNKNKIIQKGSIDIVRLRPKANEVKIELQTGGLIVDGLPFFPFGLPDGFLFKGTVSWIFLMK